MLGEEVVFMAPFKKEEIRQKAYFKWLDAGKPDCGEMDFWLKAEDEWYEEHKKD